MKIPERRRQYELHYWPYFLPLESLQAMVWGGRNEGRAERTPQMRRQNRKSFKTEHQRGQSWTETMWEICRGFLLRIQQGSDQCMCVKKPPEDVRKSICKVQKKQCPLLRHCWEKCLLPLYRLENFIILKRLDTVHRDVLPQEWK